MYPIFAFGDKFGFCAFWKDLFEPQIAKILIKFTINIQINTNFSSQRPNITGEENKYTFGFLSIVLGLFVCCRFIIAMICLCIINTMFGLVYTDTILSFSPAKFIRESNELYETILIGLRKIWLKNPLKSIWKSAGKIAVWISENRGEDEFRRILQEFTKLPLRANLEGHNLWQLNYNSIFNQI